MSQHPWGKLISTTPNGVDVILTSPDTLLGRTTLGTKYDEPRISRQHFHIKKTIMSDSTVVIIRPETTIGTYIDHTVVEPGDEVVLLPYTEVTLLHPMDKHALSYCFISTADSELDRLFLDKYKPLKFLGKGSYATVREVEEVSTSSHLAVKIVSRPEENNTFLKREEQILETLEHPNLVQCHEVLYTKSRVFFVMELVTGGDLFSYLFGDNGVGKVSESQAREVISQLLSAVKYLHAKKICHRDIKLENVLLCEKNAIQTVKLTDFGLSRVVDITQKAQTKVGSLAYCAPEILRAEVAEYDGMKVDIWSLGVVFYLLVTGEYPFGDDTLNDLPSNIVHGTFVDESLTNKMSEEFNDLIHNMLVIDPETRFNAEQCLLHEFFGTKHPSQLEE
ncbi:CBL-interacting serine/threonine protein kinase, putative [Entamoeba invadens IP1]|uniref:non-specific serine/threonine protein kinase n=1 Tax=Entamoeba invadens IP1 TaxID=370355 RepID=A0A0A1U992_ENTIV|nr:CBL-interacting serine/threonine protein kinase, putative [Entamoeba invadens IP1]ELP89756.1 CBL-interacting serine/threonine protein kinase, putative [Entamoeba invadens IP1]|eukprot:XP_004256527.1 CBL-interacting serine/threonine protein kinase, putative [Entamoeba invadens IP1]